VRSVAFVLAQRDQRWCLAAGINRDEAFMARAIVFCETCKFDTDRKVADDGRTGGEILAQEMRDLLAERGRDDVTVATQRCLWSCSRHCNVLLRDDAKYSYLTGDFAPERTSAEALLDWFDRHGASETGEVSFRQWPDGMRGHFIARIPPVSAPGPEGSGDER
jgi:predicted metal-binding protein